MTIAQPKEVIISGPKLVVCSCLWVGSR